MNIISPSTSLYLSLSAAQAASDLRGPTTCALSERAIIRNSHYNNNDNTSNHNDSRNQNKTHVNQS